MRFSDDFLTELKSRVDLVELVSRYADVQNRHTRMPRALCPFHTEKTPSFYIYTHNQSYYCFGCGAGGDAVTFIKNIEHLDYVEAVAYLCERVGMSMPADPVDDAYTALRRRCYEANRAAAKFFHTQLKAPEAQEARAYLQKRGLTNETVTHFGLGFAPDRWDALVKHLRGMGFHDDELISFYLARRTKNGGVIDAFRNRLMFPIMDLRGNVIAFGGRVLDDSKPKYLNTSDTPVFKKGQGIYALNFAKNTGDRKLILCEGYMDVIAMHQAGFTNAVAGLGTAFTPDQISLLSRYCDELILSFDSDEAGQKATARALRLLKNAPMKLRVMELSGGKDPDEIIKTQGKKTMEGIIGNARNNTEYALSRAAAQFDLHTDDGKLGFLNAAIDVLADVRSPVERDLYVTRVAQMSGTEKEPLAKQVERTAAKKKKRQQYDAFDRDARAAAGELTVAEGGVVHNPERRNNRLACKAEETILASLIKNPDYLRRLGDRLTPDLFITKLNRETFEGVAKRIRENRSVDFSMYDENGDNSAQSYLAYLYTLQDRINGSLRECEECIRTLLACKEKKEDEGDGSFSDEDFIRKMQALRDREQQKNQKDENNKK